MKRIGLIGIGKMGLSHLAIANQTPGIEVKAICDTSKQLIRAIEKIQNLFAILIVRK
jgi:predicted homoserine dehydrogenase-like protein